MSVNYGHLLSMLIPYGKSNVDDTDSADPTSVFSAISFSQAINPRSSLVPRKLNTLNHNFEAL